MIFITVGTDTHQFDRLLKEVDRLAGEKEVKDKIVAQTGNSKYVPKNYEYSDFFSEKEFERLAENSRIIISHAGAGSVIRAFEFGKPLVLVPRRKEFNEHTDDHQMELAKELEGEGRVAVVYEITNLTEAIKKAEKQKVGTPKNKPSKIIRMISERLKEWCG